MLSLLNTSSEACASIQEFNYVVEHFSVLMKEWKNEFLPSGFVDINRITGGFHSGELICLSGLTGMGCTSLALSIGYKLSTVFNHSVGFITTALSSENIGLRYLSVHSDLALSALQKGNLKDYEWQTLHLKVPYVEGSLFQTFFAETYKEMEMKCKAYSYGNVDLIIIDNINQFLRATDNDSELIVPVLEGLKSLSRQIRIPILFTYTLPAAIRGKYRNSYKRPSIADLGQIYNYVDTVLFLHRHEYFEMLEDENGESTIGMAEVIVPKSYIGSSGYSGVKFDAKSLKFDNLTEMASHTC